MKNSQLLPFQLPASPPWGKPQNCLNVLLIGEKAGHVDFYSHMICGVQACQIDLLTCTTELADWVSRVHYQLVVIDHPQAGLSLLDELRRASPLTSVILVTSKPHVDEAVAAMRLGAVDYLKSPLDPQIFQLAVQRALERQAVFWGNRGTEPFLRLLSSCQLISGSLEQKKIFDVVESYFSNELRAALSVVYTLIEEQPTLVSTESREQRRLTLCEITKNFLKNSNIFSEMIRVSDRYRLVEDQSMGVNFFVFRFRCTGINDYFCVSISPQSPEALDSFENRIQLLSAQLEVTGKNIEYYLGVQKLAYIDHATGLYNARYLTPLLEREIQHTQVTGKSFAVVFIDVDQFKSINDDYGHSFGTVILNELGNHLKKYIREKDALFRYGGDEFVGVLSGCDFETAQEVAERIRDSVQKKRFMYAMNSGSSGHQAISLTVSVGLALFPDHAKALKDLMEVADHAMYAAKRLGKNRVAIAFQGISDLKKVSIKKRLGNRVRSFSKGPVR